MRAILHLAEDQLTAVMKGDDAHALAERAARYLGRRGAAVDAPFYDQLGRAWNVAARHQHAADLAAALGRELAAAGVEVEVEDWNIVPLEPLPTANPEEGARRIGRAWADALWEWPRGVWSRTEPWPEYANANGLLSCPGRSEAEERLNRIAEAAAAERWEELRRGLSQTSISRVTAL